ncbi:MAG: XylR family transcriptional regulator [Planctomycetota bacterium]
MTASDVKKVLLWIESSRSYGRGCLLGVAAHCATHAQWRLFHVEHNLEAALPSALSTMQFDGVIARAESREIADALHSLGVPVIDLRGSHQPSNGGMIDTDAEACAELAFEHFWARGMTSMAFCGYRDVDYSMRRRDAFLKYAKERGVEPSVFEAEAPPTPRGTTTSTLQVEMSGEFESEELANWLKGLSYPAAVFAANDVRGRQVLSACSAAGIAVPEEVAVLGVDNDEVICELSHPPLSSIEPDTQAIGYAGASLLEKMLSGTEDVSAKRTQVVRPVRVVTRQSTDITAIDDLEVAKAVNVIRQQSGAIRSVEDLSAYVGVSRATLERRFRSALGRSPRQEIDRVRLDRARALVRGTTYPLHQIAEMIGYSNPSRLIDAYKRRFGVTPGMDRSETDRPLREIAL